MNQNAWGASHTAGSQNPFLRGGEPPVPRGAYLESVAGGGRIGGASPEELVTSAQQVIHGVANDVMRFEKIPPSTVVLDDLGRSELRLDQAKCMLNEALGATAGLGALYRQKATQQLQEAQSLCEAFGRVRRQVTIATQRSSERQSLLSGGGSGGAVRAGAANTSDLAHLRNERESLIYSATKLRSIVSESNAILGALKTQGDTLEGTHNRLAVDFLEAIGVSNHTLLQIARTTKLDALIVYIGIGLTMLLMLYILLK